MSGPVEMRQSRPDPGRYSYPLRRGGGQAATGWLRGRLIRQTPEGVVLWCDGSLREIAVEGQLPGMAAGDIVALPADLARRCVPAASIEVLAPAHRRPDGGTSWEQTLELAAGHRRLMGVRARVVSETPPVDHACKVEPNLEDAYILLVGGEGRADE